MSLWSTGNAQRSLTWMHTKIPLLRMGISPTYGLEIWFYSNIQANWPSTFARVNDQQQFYTDRGKWRVAHPNEMSFALGVRVPEEMITSILPYFPTSTVEKSFLPQLGLEGGVPRPAGRALLEWMESFEKAARKFYAQNSSLLDNVYDLVADEEEFRLLTLDEIGQEVFGRTPGTLTEAERRR
ncbi:hypothetical protein CIHG_09037 [Coccidioides immitis H538.4]|uniref:Uncharacterized protein n=1 Tax=Coccidioides immitis H538.4 TaxID=396776 RepID=A0A0J8S1H8_COCIT|nr:hypothetical protein CIHG_09037 [Coccidioides immitis H538.4]